MKLLTPLLFALTFALAARGADDEGAEPAIRWKITVGKPLFEALDKAPRGDVGRIFGDLKRCPGCTVRVLDPEGKLVQSTTVLKGALVYEIRSLAPGTYQIQVEAEGHQTVTLVQIGVQGKHDTRLDIRFGKGDGDESEDPPEWEPPKGRDNDKPPKKPANAKKGGEKQKKDKGRKPDRKRNPKRGKGKKRGDPKKGEKKQ